MPRSGIVPYPVRSPVPAFRFSRRALLSIGYYGVAASLFSQSREALGARIASDNAGRISLMGISLQYYEAIHSQIGDVLTNVVILIVTLGWSFLGVRRELFSHN